MESASSNMVAAVKKLRLKDVFMLTAPRKNAHTVLLMELQKKLYDYRKYYNKKGKPMQLKQRKVYISVI